LNKNQLTAPVEKSRRADRCESRTASSSMFAGKSRWVNPALILIDVLVARHHQVLFWPYMSTITFRSLSHFAALQVIMGIPAHILRKPPLFTKNKELLQILMQLLESTIWKNQLLEELGWYVLFTSLNNLI